VFSEASTTLQISDSSSGLKEKSLLDEEDVWAATVPVTAVELDVAV
jgi:hypothetical protein